MVQEWARRLKDKCEGYALKDIFNADETGHFFRSLPVRSLVAKATSARAASYQRTA